VDNLWVVNHIIYNEEGNCLSLSELLAFRLVAVAVDQSIGLEESFWHYTSKCCSHRKPLLKANGHRRGVGCFFGLYHILSPNQLKPTLKCSSVSELWLP